MKTVIVENLENELGLKAYLLSCTSLSRSQISVLNSGFTHGIKVAAERIPSIKFAVERWLAAHPKQTVRIRDWDGNNTPVDLSSV